MVSRGMQNLTARYNILFNATQIVNESEHNIQSAYQDNFDELIAVYKEPNETLSQSEIKKLDDAVFKARKVINEKDQSIYVPEASFLIAKANYLKSNFFNAAEFFTYVYKAYPNEKEISQPALTWEAKSLIQLDKFKEAKVILDTALKYIDTDKKSMSDIYAVHAQWYLHSNSYEDAIENLGKAIKFSKNNQNTIRWKYLLAQLLENAGKPDSAYIYYTTIAKSNAPFDMSFNANLNRISIGIKKKNGKVVNRTKQLKLLLKDDKNTDFIDQIYFKVANSYADSNDVENAIKNYNLSIRKSTSNRTQKGRSYLKLAEIYFKRTDYVKAKAYYDSTVNSLPTTYPDYKQLKKKAGSLELLANRLTIIAHQDSLQALAKLPEAERVIKVDSLVHEQEKKALEKELALAAAKNKSLSGTDKGQSNAVKNGKFYFNNTTALSQGSAEFKQHWGSRKLEDNWRRSQKSAADIANAPPDNPDAPNVKTTKNSTKSVKTTDDYKQSLLKSIPLTEEKLLASDKLIASAYFDIANYYRDVMNDETEAIKTYEELLKRYPENSDKMAVYYSLYRLYLTSNPEKSAFYKKLVLEQSPDSPFAKIIADPNYNQKNDIIETELNCVYNATYTLFISRRYGDVFLSAYDAKTIYGVNKLSAQLAYLQSLALGHLQKLPEFENSLKQVAKDFPNDKLIAPLIKQHLAYIDSNRTMLSSRTFALLNYDSSEPKFIEEPVAETIKVTPTTVITNDKTAIDKPGTTITKTGKSENPITKIEKPENKESLKSSASTISDQSFFSLADSAEYYYVINVPDPAINLSSSRFGIGQFNRANFAGGGIKHQLKSINNQNQLIFVGIFSSTGTVDNYLKNVTSVLPQIMKIRPDKYNTFYISKHNLDKLKDRETIDRYIEFFKKNFQQ